MTPLTAMGSYLFALGQENPEAMQSPMVRMARPLDQKGRMVQNGRRKAAAFGETDAHAMANDCTYRRTNRDAMFGAVSEVVG